MGVVFWVLLFFFLHSPHSISCNVCVCKSDANAVALQSAIDFACGNGADCRPLQIAPCSSLNTLIFRCSYAVASYYQKSSDKSAMSCNFSGTAGFASTIPSNVPSGCNFPGYSNSPASSNTPGSYPNGPPSNSLTPPATSFTPSVSSYPPPGFSSMQPPPAQGYATPGSSQGGYPPPGSGSVPGISTTTPGATTPPAAGTMTPLINGGAMSPVNNFSPDSSGAAEICNRFSNFSLAALWFCSLTLLLMR